MNRIWASTLVLFSISLLSFAQTPVNKANTARIGLVLPLGIPGYPIEVWTILSAFSAESYNPIVWYLDKLNQRTDILPDLKLELVTTNTMYDRGMTLTTTQALSSQGAIAVIGEVASRNSVTAALVASISKMLHCNPHSTATAMSNKVDYPYTFRATPSIAQYAGALIALVRSQNITSFAVLATDDEVI
ncbi:hypothetical protein HDU97_000751 [Phlyctochytrium planicorne]|nr:hypothetical protein HDU97_000751 [Phlyctochytrium planicorne]